MLAKKRFAISAAMLQKFFPQSRPPQKKLLLLHKSIAALNAL